MLDPCKIFRFDTGNLFGALGIDELLLGRRHHQGAGIRRRVGASGDHDLRHLDLPEWLYALHQGESRQGHMFVPQNLDGFWANILEQISIASNRVHRQVESLRDSLFRHTRVERLQDHAVRLDGRDSVHLLVVGVAFVLGRDETWCLDDAEVSQDFNPSVSVEDEVLSSLPWVDAQGFDDADLPNGSEKRTILRRLAHVVAGRSRREQFVEPNGDPFELERSLGWRERHF